MKNLLRMIGALAVMFLIVSAGALFGLIGFAWSFAEANFKIGRDIASELAGIIERWLDRMTDES